MASLLDLFLTVVDPGNAVISGFIYVRLKDALDRIKRLEGTYITDGGQPVEEPDAERDNAS